MIVLGPIACQDPSINSFTIYSEVELANHKFIFNSVLGCVCVSVCLCMLPEVESSALCMPVKCFTSEVHPQPMLFF